MTNTRTMLSRLLLTTLLALPGAAAVAAPMPRLDKAPPTLCALSRDTGWVVSAAQAAAIEKALPAYLAALKADASQLPAGKYVYGRQYRGFMRDGRRLIWGSFYPATDPVTTHMKPGSCWTTFDGGNAFWNITFDPQTGKIIDLRVNGIA